MCAVKCTDVFISSVTSVWCFINSRRTPPYIIKHLVTSSSKGPVIFLPFLIWQSLIKKIPRKMPLRKSFKWEPSLTNLTNMTKFRVVLRKNLKRKAIESNNKHKYKIHSRKDFTPTLRMLTITWIIHKHAVHPHKEHSK